MVPSILCSSNEVDLTDVLKQYAEDLPNPDAVFMEIRNWKRFWFTTSDSELPHSLAAAINRRKGEGGGEGDVSPFILNYDPFENSDYAPASYQVVLSFSICVYVYIFYKHIKRHPQCAPNE